MNWKTAKTVLLLLLLIVNLILGGLWLYREMQTRAGETQAVEELCLLLEQNGLSARPEDLVDTASLTYDAELVPGGDAKSLVFDLPVWETTVSSVGNGRFLVSEAAESVWGEELPVDGNPSFSAGYCLLKMTVSWGLSGKTLERCELGFSAEPLSTDAVRLKPCWRFTISGEEYYWLAV
ncbi:MAG: hypothetical protein LBR76_08920 [Oscillospiraceae bacterium]|nr:hypothetical protein [Oscillospiraceae bacterium]